MSGAERAEPEAFSDTEKVGSETLTETDQPGSGTEPRETVAAAAAAVKVRRQVTPKQLEALRLARIRKQEKAAARKEEYAKLIERVSIEQGSDDSDSGVEYVIKRVRKGKGRTAGKPTSQQTPPEEESSDSDNARPPALPPKTNPPGRAVASSPQQPEFALHFV